MAVTNLNVGGWHDMMMENIIGRNFMEDILSSLIVAIITSILTVLGTLYVQKRKSESIIRKNALYLYLNLKQVKYDIDNDKRVIDRAGESEIMPMNYFSPFDYIAVLSGLKDKMTDEEIEVVNNFYEAVKKLDNKKMYFFNMRNLHNNSPSTNPAFLGPYELQYRNSYNDFERNLNVITNSDEYKMNLVEIISKLKKMKDK